MGTLETTLRAKRDSGRKLLMPYITAGIIDDWVDIVRACADAGADGVEIGIPFSDPVMDGPSVQAASEMSLARGTTPIQVFSDLRHLEDTIPMIAMTYANVPYRMGFERYVAECAASGIHGAILPDVPMEEMGEWTAAVGEADLDTVMLASPISSDERLAALAEMSRGFVYGVNVLGITGERADIGVWSAKLAGRLKAITDLPVVMGFGIADGKTAVQASEASDGVAVGSALVRILVDGGSVVDVGDFVAGLRRALDEG